jgi:type VI secretion system protein ImpB
MVVGDFLRSYDARRLSERKPISVNKNNLEDVMAKQNLTLKLSVPNHLTDDKDIGDLPVTLKISKFRDFSPEGVAKQVPELNKLLELREALVSLKGPLGNMPTFSKTIEEILSDSSQRERVIKELGIKEEEKDKG